MPPAQPKADFTQDPAPQPEVALLAAVIEQALVDLGGANTREACEAWSFLTEQRGAWARSRAFVCGALGLDPNSVREAIIRRYKDPNERLRASQTSPLRGHARALARPPENPAAHQKTPGPKKIRLTARPPEQRTG